MRFDATTVAALATLTEALDETGTDIAETVSRLGDFVAAAVPSFVALSLQTGLGDARIEFTGRSDKHEDLAGIRTSLVIPLPDQGATGFRAESGTTLILYAGQPGAFVDVAADISWLTGRPLESLRIDEHLDPPAKDGSVALRDVSTVNQAIGVLIERGFTVDEAIRHLDQLAAFGGTASAAAAAVLLSRLSADDTAP